MMRHANFLTAAILILTTLPLQAQKAIPPTQAELDAITFRGRQLLAYDMAASLGTDAVVALKPDPKLAPVYLARQTESGWTVSFGRLSEAKDKFTVVYEAVQKDAHSPKEFDAHQVDTPREDTGALLNAYRAIDLAKKSYAKPAERPYNVAVLPAPQGQFWVYLFPAQTQADVLPLGGDIRYLISKDGAKIVAQRRLHKSILDLPLPRGEQIASGYHTAILADLPEDTDVLYVLMRKPAIPEYIGTPHFMYKVETNGVIHLDKKKAPVGKAKR